MIGGELTGFDDFTLSLVTNAELLEIEKNSYCAHQLWRKHIDDCEQIAWFAPAVSGDAWYLAMFNAGEKETTISVDLTQLGIAPEKAYDIWEKASVNVDETVTAKVNPHGVCLLKLKR